MLRSLRVCSGRPSAARPRARPASSRRCPRRRVGDSARSRRGGCAQKPSMPALAARSVMIRLIDLAVSRWLVARPPRRIGPNSGSSACPAMVSHSLVRATGTTRRYRSVAVPSPRRVMSATLRAAASEARSITSNMAEIIAAARRPPRLVPPLAATDAATPAVCQSTAATCRAAPVRRRCRRRITAHDGPTESGVPVTAAVMHTAATI